MWRRTLCFSLAALLPGVSAAARPKLGDAEWLRRFGVFIRELNHFLLALNEDRLDRARWSRVQAAWAELQTENSASVTSRPLGTEN